MAPGPGYEAVHSRCGLPMYQDEQGSWHHAEPADGFICDLLFSGGSMLDALLGQEPED